MLDCTHTHMHIFPPNVCVWWCFVAAKRLFRFSLHAGAIDSSHNSELADCSTSYETTSNSHILLLLTIYFRPNSKKKKGFHYSNSVYVYLIIMMITGSTELRILLSVFR